MLLDLLRSLDALYRELLGPGYWAFSSSSSTKEDISNFQAALGLLSKAAENAAANGGVLSTSDLETLRKQIFPKPLTASRFEAALLRLEVTARRWSEGTFEPVSDEFISMQNFRALLLEVQQDLAAARALGYDSIDVAGWMRDAVDEFNASIAGETLNLHSIGYAISRSVADGGAVLGGPAEIRGVLSSPAASRPVVLSPDTTYTLSMVHAESRRFGRATFRTGAEGTTVQMPSVVLVDLRIVDTDGDGLDDAIEEVLGLSEIDQDTDGDGIPDGAEVDNGTNPLDGLAVSTGIIASADTPGIPVDISAIDDIAIVANSAAGITVFNVRAGLNPLRIAQLDTPGTALAVSSSGGLIAVADGSEGLQIVDFSDPPSARIVRQIPVNSLGGGSAQCVATAANLAFVGTTQGSVSMVGLDTGIVFQRLDLGGSVHDLAIEGTTLYAYAEGKLHVLPFALGPMQLAGSVSSPGTTEIGRPRLFVGNGIAYTVQAQGYNTFSVVDPAKPVLLASGSTTQFGWKQIVLNGSGLGVAANAPTSRPDSRHNVFLYDTSDPTRNDVFLTQFETPGVARAISLYNGLAYVADSASPGFIAEASSRMHVVNYLAYDNRKQPPTGTITTSSTNGTVTGGGFVVLRAEVRDDVQVRNVEFFVEGQRIAIDGNFPFEVVYRVPTNSTGRNLNVWARLYDTGGNTTSVTNATLAVVPDNQPPGISIDSPSDNQIFFIGDEVPIRVTAIDNSGIDSVTFTLNGIAVPVRRLSFYEWRLDMNEPPTGTNVLVATATDLAGLKGISRPLRFVVLKEAVSREVSVFNLEVGTLVEAISREVSTFNLGADSQLETISREVSTFNGGVDEVDEAISREVSTFNFGPPDKPETISREVSIENPNPPSAAPALQAGSAPKGEVR